MLYKNHVKVDFTTDPLFLSVKNEFESLLKNKKSIVIRTHDKVIINPTGYKEYDRGQAIPVTATVRNSAGTDDDFWVYCERSPKIKQNGEKEYDKTPIIIYREMNVSTTEKDKIFYLLYLSKASKTGRIFAVNDEKEDELKVNKLGQSARINFLLMDELSPVNDITIQKVAKAFGVSNVDNLPMARVRLLLKNVIDISDASNDTSRNSAAFIEAVNMGDNIRTRAMVQEAIDAQKIGYNSEGAYFAYYSNGEEIKKIMNIDLLIAGDNIKRMNALCGYFTSSQQKRDELVRLMNYTVEDVDFSIYEYVSLKKFLSMHGQSGKGNQQELIDRATDFYEKNKDIIKIDMSILAVAIKADALTDSES